MLHTTLDCIFEQAKDKDKSLLYEPNTSFNEDFNITIIDLIMYFIHIHDLPLQLQFEQILSTFMQSKFSKERKLEYSLQVYVMV